MFVSILVPRSDLEHPSDAEAVQRGFLGAYYQNEEWEGEPAIVRREPTILFHFHWHQEALPGVFSADWTASLKIERSGPYSFELATSDPSVLLVDEQTLISTSNLDQELYRQGTITLSQGEHRLVVRCLKKGSLATIYLAWRPPGGSPEVIPMRLLRPFSREEYVRLRDSLPRPGTQ
jgi:PA14 domain